MQDLRKELGPTRGADEGADYLNKLMAGEVPAKLVKEAKGIIDTAEEQLGKFKRDLSLNELKGYFRNLFKKTSFQGIRIIEKPDDYFEIHSHEKEDERAGKVGDEYLSTDTQSYYIWFAPKGKILNLVIAKKPSNGGWRGR